VAMEGYCPVQLVENNRWVRGTHEAGVIHRGRLYLCATPEQRRRFLADPDRYAPVLSGNDPVLAVDQNQLVPGQRKYGLRFVADGRVYLFATQVSRDKFAQDPDRYAAAVTRAMEATARRVAPPESPYGPGPALQPNGRY
jgi:YHS domain-containing protein